MFFFSVISIFYLSVNVFCLTLSVGLSPRVPRQTERGIEKNETSQPAGTVHEI